MFGGSEGIFGNVEITRRVEDLENVTDVGFLIGRKADVSGDMCEMPLGLIKVKGNGSK